MNWQLPIGAQLNDTGVRFRVWASNVNRLEVVIYDHKGQELSTYPLRRDEFGYYLGQIEGMQAGVRYMYRLDGNIDRPDPASRYQPEGVHGPSEVVSSKFNWTDSNWKGLPANELIIYEVHIGTATPTGTFEAFIEKLDYVKQLGVTAIEIMPVADFPGNRNWGYDGVNLFAPARSYGGPQELKKLVDAAHAKGLAVIQDVVYNHFGPDGNYLRNFSQEYFTESKKTPWGDAINFSCEAVREYFIANAMYWAKEYHMDGLRMDAIHAILDDSPQHILQELVARVHQSLPEDRHFVFTAEDDRNEVWLLRPQQEDGAGIDALWADDFHHQVRSALAGDNEGYFQDFSGNAADLAETLNKGWFYTGQESRFAGKPRGTDACHFDPYHFIYCIQNHDQIGNRPLGDRLNAIIDPAEYRTASALLLLSPGTPLLFHGQEWGATTPFLYFTDHNADLGKLVTEGRRSEFEYFAAFNHVEVPDPQAQNTFENSRLNWNELEEEAHSQLILLYKDLLAMRQKSPLLHKVTRQRFQSQAVGDNSLVLRYGSESGEDGLLVVVNLKGEFELDLWANKITEPPQNTRWQLHFTSNNPRYGGNDKEAELWETMASNRVKANGPVVYMLQAQH
ncbi:MAG TPA: malto-oligosyltrehalose trehalohydrolase [Chloroflexia bacterium]|nr:malto-oligosyltrehalose trehalohydrolase [Chloroflexia bacterium]